MRRSAAATLALLLMTASAWGADLATARQEIMDRLSAIESNAEAVSEPERLAAFIDLYLDYVILEFPEFATYFGLAGDHGRWSDNSLATIARRDSEQARGLEVLRTIDRSRLEGVDRLNYDLLLEDEEEQVAAQRFLGEYLPITQMNGVQQDVAQLLSMMPARNLQQYEDLLSRLQGVPEVVDQTLVRLQKGLELGVTPPRVTLRDVPEQVRNQIVEEPMTSPMLQPFVEFPEGVSPADQQRLREDAVRVYSEQIVPAFERLYAYLVETYLPGCRESIAMSALPDGEAWYAHNVKSMTTTDLTPRQIHDIGLSEVKRIRAEMERVKSEAGFAGSLDEFFDFLRSDPQFFYTEGRELLSGYRDIAKRVDAELPRLFGHLPRLPYGVSPVPEYAEKSQTTAYYEPGSIEAGRSGTFFANTYDLPSRPKWEMEALTLHEAVPGHHFQIAIAQELEDLPWFRRYGGATAFVEGWGLYAESLGEEIGFYQDPYSKFGQLTYEMWRAIRLVVDTGMHALGWSRQQAIDFFMANAGKAEHDIVVEVDRYIVWPGQALAYKIGELEIKKLRAMAQQELGESFDLRAFHDQLLGNGALPLKVLAAHMEEWVERQKAATSG
jgi:uncharacterized protein (DUF885 family)